MEVATAMNFAEHFWGEKNNGFDVLYQNMKLGHVACQDLIEYLRESVRVEETYGRSLGKLVLKANNANQNGSFAPVWQIIKAFPEKLIHAHSQMVHQLQDLLRELGRYSDELHSKHKSVKETESTTEECVRNMRSTLVAVHKAKDNYKQRIIELEKFKRENGSTKDVEKTEARVKKTKEDYKTYVEKYGIVREDFNRKMVESSTRFQEIEETHLRRLREFVDKYADVWETVHRNSEAVSSELQENLSAMTCQRILEHFVETRSTGTERPPPIDFESADEILNGHALPASVPGTPDADSIGSGFGGEDFIPGGREGSTGGSGGSGGRGVGGAGGSMAGVAGSIADLDGSQSGSASNVAAASEPVPPPPPPTKSSAFPKISLPGPGKFFRPSKEKRKKKTRKKKKGEESEDDMESSENKPQVDEEGFSIRPEFAQTNKDDDSSSFSDSDDDDPRLKKGFNVVIRPLEETQGFNGVARREPGATSASGSSAEAMAALLSSARGLRSPSQVAALARNSQASTSESDATWGAGWDEKIKRTQSQSSSESVRRPRSTSFTLHNPPTSAESAPTTASGLTAPTSSRRAASVTPQQSLLKQRASHEDAFAAFGSSFPQLPLSLPPRKDDGNTTDPHAVGASPAHKSAVSAPPSDGLFGDDDDDPEMLDLHRRRDDDSPSPPPPSLPPPSLPPPSMPAPRLAASQASPSPSRKRPTVDSTELPSSTSPAFFASSPVKATTTTAESTSAPPGVPPPTYNNDDKYAPFSEILSGLNWDSKESEETSRRDQSASESQQFESAAFATPTTSNDNSFQSALSLSSSPRKTPLSHLGENFASFDTLAPTTTKAPNVTTDSATLTLPLQKPKSASTSALPRHRKPHHLPSPEDMLIFDSPVVEDKDLPAEPTDKPEPSVGPRLPAPLAKPETDSPSLEATPLSSLSASPAHSVGGAAAKGQKSESRDGDATKKTGVAFESSLDPLDETGKETGEAPPPPTSSPPRSEDLFSPFDTSHVTASGPRANLTSPTPMLQPRILSQIPLQPTSSNAPVAASSGSVAPPDQLSQPATSTAPSAATFAEPLAAPPAAQVPSSSSQPSSSSALSPFSSTSSAFPSFSPPPAPAQMASPAPPSSLPSTVIARPRPGSVTPTVGPRPGAAAAAAASIDSVVPPPPPRPSSTTPFSGTAALVGQRGSPSGSRNSPTPQATPVYQSKFARSVSASTAPHLAGLKATASPFDVPLAKAGRSESVASAAGLAAALGAETGTLRGPSPLGFADAVPVAVAVTETANAIFKGSDTDKTLVKITGEVLLSFPAGIVPMITGRSTTPNLALVLRGVARLDQVLPNKQLLGVDYNQSNSDVQVFEFSMSNLTDHLKRLHEQNRNASYYNVEVIRYLVKNAAPPPPTVPISPLSKISPSERLPLHIVSYWKCEISHTDLRVDYRLHPEALLVPSPSPPPSNGPHAVTPATPTPPLVNASFTVLVDGEVKLMQSKPPGTWSSENRRAQWKMKELPSASGSLYARFELDDGPSTPSSVGAQFFVDGATLSGVDVQIRGKGYRLSLVKRRIKSGKYLSEADTEVRFV